MRDEAQHVVIRLVLDWLIGLRRLDGDAVSIRFEVAAVLESHVFLRRETGKRREARVEGRTPPGIHCAEKTSWGSRGTEARGPAEAPEAESGKMKSPCCAYAVEVGFLRWKASRSTHSVKTMVVEACNAMWYV